MKGTARKTLTGLVTCAGLVLSLAPLGRAQTKEASSVKLQDVLPTQTEISACASDLYCSKLRLGLRKQSDLTRLLFITDPSALAGVPEVSGLIQGAMRDLPGFGAPLGVSGQGITIGPDANGLPSTGQTRGTGIRPSGFAMLDLVRKVSLGDFAQDHGWSSEGTLQIGPGGPRGGHYAAEEGGEPSGGESTPGNDPDAGGSTPSDPTGSGSDPSGSGSDPDSPENDWQYDWSYVPPSPDTGPNWTCCADGSSFAPGWMFPPGDPRYQPIIVNRPGGGTGPYNGDVDSSMTPRPSAAGLSVQVPNLRIKPGVVDPVYRPTDLSATKGDQTPDGTVGGRPLTETEKKQALRAARFAPGRTAGAIRPEEGGTIGPPIYTSPVGGIAPTGCAPGRPCPGE